MKKFYLFKTNESRAMRSITLLLSIGLLWGVSVVSAFAQSSQGSTITFDSSNCTALQSNYSVWFSFLRHNQAPIQVLNANPNANSNQIAALQEAWGTGNGMFSSQAIANNMVFSSGGKLEFYNNYASYNALCFAVMAPKGYRFTEYWMDICSTKASDAAMNNSGAKNAVIERYTYNEGTTYQYTLASGESMTLSGTSSEIYTHTLNNAGNILYFRVKFAQTSSQSCVHMNQLRLTYVADGEFEATIPNSSNENKVRTGILNLGEFTYNGNTYSYNSANVTDLEDVNIVAEDETAEMAVSDGAIEVSKGGTYWIESPAKFRILGANITFKAMTVSGGYEAQSTTFTPGKTYLIGNGSGGYMGRIDTHAPASNQTNQNNAERWTIKQTSSGRYTIQNSAGYYLYLNNGSLGVIESLSNIPSGNYYSGEWQFNSSTRALYATSGSRTYRIYLSSNSWTLNRYSSYTSLYFYEVKESYTADNYTADVYNKDNTGVAGSVTINSANGSTSGSVNLTDIDNDGVKFTVSGPAAFTVDLTLSPLNPTLQSLDFGYKLKDGVTDADYFTTAQASNFMFNGGEPIVIPIAPEGDDNGASHKVVFRNAYNENRSDWYDGTKLGDSQYYMIGSAYEMTGSETNAPYDKTNADQAGTVEMDFSNIKELTGSGGLLTETNFNKSDAGFADIVLTDGAAAQTIYIYSADRPTHNIMTEAGKNVNRHTAYTRSTQPRCRRWM